MCAYLIEKEKFSSNSSEKKNLSMDKKKKKKIQQINVREKLKISFASNLLKIPFLPRHLLLHITWVEISYLTTDRRVHTTYLSLSGLCHVAITTKNDNKHQTRLDTKKKMQCNSLKIEMS